MEELLNKLIDKWWRPRGLTPMWKMEVDYDIYFAFEVYDSLQCWHFSFREITSKESWLRQFVCENGYIREIETDWLEIRNWDNPKHWIAESALCDEDKLEDFILENIKI